MPIDEDSPARFRVRDTREILRDPGGHQHHWTFLIGELEAGTFSVGAGIAIPRVAGGFWLSRVLGFELFRRQLGNRIKAVDVRGTTLAICAWGLAPPQGTVTLGAHAHAVDAGEAARLLVELEHAEGSTIEHCDDCRKVRTFGQRAAP